MKKTKRCPKCTSSRIAGPHYQTRGIYLKIFRTVSRFCYICADCGYVEYYLNSKDLDNLEKHGKFESEI